MADLDYTLEISTPSGWLLLEDEANGYTLDAATTTDVTTTRRDRTTAGQWVEGTFTIASVKDNEVVPVAVRVDAPTPAQYTSKMRALKAAFDQLTYQIRETFGVGAGAQVVTVWTCMPGQYTESTTGPSRFARTGVLAVQVPRLPTQAVTYT